MSYEKLQNSFARLSASYFSSKKHNLNKHCISFHDILAGIISKPESKWQ